MMVKSYKFIVLVLLSFVVATTQAQELLDYPLDTIHGEEVYRYEVERSIGLYRIGVNFKVSQGDIIRLNPQLEERGLHYGETIYIPTGRPINGSAKTETPAQEKAVPEAVEFAEIAELAEKTEIPEAAETPKAPEIVEVAEVVEVTENPDEPESSETVESEPTKRNLIPGDSLIELALMLPFESQQMKRSGNADRMLEFYQGALLALRELQEDGRRFVLHVYDSERSEQRVNMLCDSSELEHVCGILGLVYPIQIERMAVWCETHQVPLLVPFSDDIDLARHPQVLQFNSTDQQEADSLCRWLTERDSLLHITAVDVKEADMAASIRTLRQTVKANGLQTSLLPLRDLLNDSASYAFDKEKENVIILHTDRFQHARILLPHLVKLQEEGYAIRIVSQYSWQKENIDLPQVYTSVFTQAEGREAYDALWAHYYVGEHVSDSPRYDLLGYDLMKALTGWLQGEQTSTGLQSEIRWVQNGEGGWQNAEVKVVER